ncbi:hypothetical protein FALBO_10852 [Fusarium albosuccineum]|uniref:Uncharacterized protein n=1 Tax=Fusarium albosuccineum TaxID=1237068 RepID=A0A8H4L3N2_9HYPO|nr:hypothetical protein FALBO_10852 [Fusarium albosuccineum]
MGIAGGLAGLYRRSMENHPYGYALYEPAPFSRLQPGTVGYLDDYQRWHPILNLNDTEAVQNSGYPPVGHLQRCDPDVHRVGPLLSTGTSKTNLELEAGAGAAALGLPVDVSGAIKYSTSNEFGAVLMFDSDVVVEGFDLRDPFRTWMQQNAKSLFEKYPDVKKHGLCAVTGTYSSNNIHISAWEGDNNSATVGFKGGMAGVANVGQHMSWIRGQSSAGWSAWTDQKRVVFFTGVKMTMGFFGRPKERNLCCAIEEVKVGGDDEGDDFEVDLEPFGDDWHQIKGISTQETAF